MGRHGQEDGQPGRLRQALHRDPAGGHHRGGPAALGGQCSHARLTRHPRGHGEVHPFGHRFRHRPFPGASCLRRQRHRDRPSAVPRVRGMAGGAIHQTRFVVALGLDGGQRLRHHGQLIHISRRGQHALAQIDDLARRAAPARCAGLQRALRGVDERAAGALARHDGRGLHGPAEPRGLRQLSPASGRHHAVARDGGLPQHAGQPERGREHRPPAR